ncbi:hypothetical protein ACLMJK_001967 [Lecanora helva]
MGITSPKSASFLSTKSVSHIDTYPLEDSASLSEGNITPPEADGEDTHGINEISMPHSLHPSGKPPSSTTELPGHGRLVLSRWDSLLDILLGQTPTLVVEGNSLDLAAIVAVARYGADVTLGGSVPLEMSKGSEFLRTRLAQGHTIYGVNTGFGGSANTHTNKVEKLQRNLINFLNCGILPAKVTNSDVDPASTGSPDFPFATALPNEDLLASSVLPESWVRGTILVRTNSLASGNSGVRIALIDGLLHMLKHNITPVIPLRGSISASGDLIPLSYVAGALQGSPGVSVWMTESKGQGRQQIPADVALSRHEQAPLRLGPKEGLAIVNGTAVSASVGALALHDAHGLVILSQILTAMGVEALRGSAESFDPFFAKIRPHPGQAEVARNIRSFLKGSKLVSDDDHDYENSDTLRQDRYSIRTTPQWIGPQLENLMLADKQISIEVNATTDNPIVDADHERILHGGNFQAMSVTSAMEKIRSVTQVIGQMLFSQCTELISPSFNNGLSPNLTADEPSQDYLLKGIDISVASLQAELGFLAGPVTPHVQSAEMGNQSLNSLALLSARYTHTALNVLAQLSAAYLLTLCQALDLRAMHRIFLSSLESQFRDRTIEILGSLLLDLDRLHHRLWLQFKRELARTTGIDSKDRFSQITNSLQPILFAHACSTPKPSSTGNLIEALQIWTQTISSLAFDTFHNTRASYAQSPSAHEILGPASSRMYEFVRGPLGVPFQMAFSHSKDPGGTQTLSWKNEETTVGMQVSEIHAAIMNGALYVPVMECMREVENGA